jgi:hypothetical protein
MDSDTLDRLSRLFGVPGTRRAALGALLGTAVPGTTLGSAAAKSNRNGKSKARGKRKRTSGARAAAKNKPGNHCISPSGADLNQVFGVSAQIVATFCTEVGAGEQWTVAEQIWAVAQTFEEVPAEFEPAGETPLADFLAKFEAVKYVIDPGTKHERTVVVSTGDALFVNDVDEELDVVSPTPLGTLKPLPVGQHVVEAYWVFRGMHCDGLGPDPALQCFPVGETLFHTVEFEVTPGHN